MEKERQILQARLHFLGQVADATAADAILDTVKCYLASWSKASVEALQTLDGGWSPFDANQKPLPIPSAAHLRCVRDAVHTQCMALREARLAIGAELAELEAFLFIAHYRLQALGAEDQGPRATVLALAA